MNETKKICIIMADITEDYRDEFIVGIEKQANKLGYHTFVFSMLLLDEIHTKKEEEVYGLIDFNQYDGVVFFQSSFSALKSLGNMLETYIHKSCKKPVIVLGDSQLFPETYHPDNRNGIEALTDHVIEEHGCETLYFLGGEANQPLGNDVGFMNSLAKHGLPCTDDNLIYGGYWMECGEALAKDIAYNLVEKPDAVICQDDTVAFFLIKALAKYGIRVPEDIIVTGFDARRDSRNNVLSITTYPSNAEHHGRLVMNRLHTLITGCEEPQITPPKCNIITGMSCGCGDRKPQDIRLQLELHEKHRMAEIYYKNSELEEKLCSCKDYKELHPVILHSSYLIQDKSFLAFHIKESETTSRCIYARNHLWKDEPIIFNSTELYPRHLLKNESKNLHILPMTFNNQFIGHAVVGYDGPIVYNNILKRYISRLAIAISIINNRSRLISSLESVPNASSEPALSISENAKVQETIIVQKNNSLLKVPLENILLFESENRKTIAVMKSGRYEIKKTLSQLEELYSNKNFLRVSKSTLVNLTKVIEITPDVDRTLMATLPGKVTVHVSRKHANEFKEKVNIK